MLVPSPRSDERHQPRYRPDAHTSHEADVRTTAVLCADQAVRHLRPLLRRQLKRHPQEISQHGRPRLRLSLICRLRGTQDRVDCKTIFNHQRA